MGFQETFFILLKLGIGFAASIVAISVWSKTRKASWIFVVLGTLLLFGREIYSILLSVGILQFNSLIDQVIPFIPLLFLFIALLLFLIDNRRY